MLEGGSHTSLQRVYAFLYGACGSETFNIIEKEIEHYENKSDCHLGILKSMVRVYHTYGCKQTQTLFIQSFIFGHDHGKFL